MKRFARRLAIVGAVAGLALFAAATASAQVVHVYGDYGYGGWGTGYYHGYYPHTVQRRIPYFAAHPPVYYDGIVARSYGWSPYAYPPYPYPPALHVSPMLEMMPDAE